MDTILVESKWITLDAGADQTLNCGSSLAFYSPSVAGATPADFMWNNGDNCFFCTNVEPGAYCITVTNDFGCKDEDCFIIFQNPTGQDMAIGVPDVICAGSSAIFYNSSLNVDSAGNTPVVGWTWDPGDGNPTSSISDSMVNTYATAGMYEITLTMNLGGGCTETITQMIEVV